MSRKDGYSEEELRNILGGTRITSEKIDGKIKETLLMIRGNEVDHRRYPTRNMYRDKKKRRRGFRRKMARSFGAAAAVLLLAFGICAVNPALAAEIPVIGSIFEKVRDVFSFGRLPQDEVVELTENSVDGGKAGEADTAGRFQTGTKMGDRSRESERVKSVQNAGFTITFTEYYATDQAVYLGVCVESEEALPKLAVMGETGYQLMQMHVKQKYSFREDVISSAWPVEGIQEDAHTFVGIMRIDYESIRVDSRRYEEACEEAERKGEPLPEINETTRDYWLDEIEIPEMFEVDMQIYRIWAYSSEMAGKYEKSGEWGVSFEITQSSEGMRSISVDEVNEEGIGIDHIELTPVELSVHTVETKGRLFYTAVLDRNGLALPAGNAYWSDGGSKCEMMIGKHDISEVTVYICDYDAYMEIDKTLMTPGEYREELERLALFKKEIQIEKD